MCYLKSNLLSSNKKLVHGFVTINEKKETNQIAADTGLRDIKTVKQVHGEKLVVLSDTSELSREYEADAVVSLFNGHGVGVFSADCVPILFFDQEKNIFGAVHAGWKGTQLGITNMVFEYILNDLNCSGDNTLVALGPCIEGECYEVGEDVASGFQNKYPDCGSYLKNIGNKKYLLDLKKANIEQITAAGISNIDVMGQCTKCNEKLPSYRREGKGAGRMLSFIGLV